MVEQWPEKPCVSGSIPLSDIRFTISLKFMNIKSAQLLIGLKNSSNVKKKEVEVFFTKMSYQIIERLYNEGFIQSFYIKEPSFSKTGKKIVVILKYLHNKSMFSDLKILSKPSLIKYVSLKDLKKTPKKKTVVFLSTTKGILTDSQCKLRSIGGKLLFSL